MGAGKETSKETALEAERTGFQSQQLHMMTIYEWTRVIYLELFRYWLFIHTYTIIYMSRLMMLMLDCQHVDCYMIYRIARYFDQLGFLGAAPCLEVELFLACLVLVWIPGPWEGVQSRSVLTLDFGATRFSAMAWLFQIPYHILCLLFFSWEISVIFYFRPFFGRWMTLVAASLISTRTKLWLIADASLGVSVFLFFSHFSPGCTDISLYNTLSYCIYYIDIVHIYIQRYFYLLCCQLPLHVWIWASTYELFLSGPGCLDPHPPRGIRGPRALRRSHRRLWGQA